MAQASNEGAAASGLFGQVTQILAKEDTKAFVELYKEHGPSLFAHDDLQECFYDFQGDKWDIRGEIILELHRFFAYCDTSADLELSAKNTEKSILFAYYRLADKSYGFSDFSLKFIEDASKEQKEFYEDSFTKILIEYTDANHTALWDGRDLYFTICNVGYKEPKEHAEKIFFENAKFDKKLLNQFFRMAYYKNYTDLMAKIYIEHGLKKFLREDGVYYGSEVLRVFLNCDTKLKAAGHNGDIFGEYIEIGCGYHWAIEFIKSTDRALIEDKRGVFSKVLERAIELYASQNEWGSLYDIYFIAKNNEFKDVEGALKKSAANYADQSPLFFIIGIEEAIEKPDFESARKAMKESISKVWEYNHENHFCSKYINDIANLKVSLAKFFEGVEVPAWLKGDLSLLEAYLVLGELERAGPESEIFHRVEILYREDEIASFQRVGQIISEGDVVNLHGLAMESEMIKRGDFEGFRASLMLRYQLIKKDYDESDMAFSPDKEEHHSGIFKYLIVDGELMINYVFRQMLSIREGNNFKEAIFPDYGHGFDAEFLESIVEFFHRADFELQCEILGSFGGDKQATFEKIAPQASKLEPNTLIKLQKYGYYLVSGKEVAFDIVSNSIARIEESLLLVNDPATCGENSEIMNLLYLCQENLYEYPEILMATIIRFGASFTRQYDGGWSNLSIADISDNPPQDIKEIIATITAEQPAPSKVEKGVQCDLDDYSELKGLPSKASGQSDFAKLKDQVCSLVQQGKVVKVNDFMVRKAVQELLFEKLPAEDIGGPFHKQFFMHMVPILSGAGDMVPVLTKMFGANTKPVHTTTDDLPPLVWNLTDMIYGSEYPHAVSADFMGDTDDDEYA